MEEKLCGKCLISHVCKVREKYEAMIKDLRLLVVDSNNGFKMDEEMSALIASNCSMYYTGGK